MLQFRFTPVGLFLRLCKCALRSSIFRMVSMCILKLGELTYVAIQGIKRLFGTVAGPVQLPNYFFLCEAFGRQFFVHRIAHLTHGGRLQADPCRGSACLDQCGAEARSEEHTSELQSLMRISYAVFCLKKKKTKHSK